MVHVIGELDLDSRDAVDRACFAGNEFDVRIDMRELCFMDCSGYGGLVATRLALEAIGWVVDYWLGRRSTTPPAGTDRQERAVSAPERSVSQESVLIDVGRARQKTSARRRWGLVCVVRSQASAAFCNAETPPFDETIESRRAVEGRARMLCVPEEMADRGERA